MNTLTTVLAILVALEHLYIMFLETIATSSESTSRVFSISVDQLKSKTIATLLKNQGVYNGLIAVLLLVARRLSKLMSFVGCRRGRETAVPEIQKWRRSIGVLRHGTHVFILRLQRLLCHLAQMPARAY